MSEELTERELTEREIREMPREQFEQLHLPGMEPGEVDGDAPPPAPETGYDIDPADEENTPARQPCLTAFIVFITEDGKAIGHPDVAGTLATITTKRPASFDDMRRACREVADDITTILMTQNVLQSQMQAAQQMQQQMEAARLAAQLGQNGGLGGGKLLG